MIDPDIPQLTEMLSALADLYRVKLSRPMLEIWISAMRPYDIAAVRAALSWHATHGDAGQFMPKPADVVRHIEGSSQDKALGAWNKVFDAIRLVGPWTTVAFDDALIHVVVRDMGSWQELCMVTFDELPFKQREFITLYRSYAARNEVPSRIPRLTGYADQENQKKGYVAATPALIGNPNRAALVATKAIAGAGAAQISIGTFAEQAMAALREKAALPALEAPREIDP